MLHEPEAQGSLPRRDTTVRMPCTYQPRACRTCRVPWHSRLRRTEEAIGCCTEALEATAATAASASQPEHASFFHALLGESLAAASHPLRAARSFRRAAALQPYATHWLEPQTSRPNTLPPTPHRARTPD